MRQLPSVSGIHQEYVFGYEGQVDETPGVSKIVSGAAAPLTSMDTSEGMEQCHGLKELNIELALEKDLHRQAQEDLLKAQQALSDECS